MNTAEMRRIVESAKAKGLLGPKGPSSIGELPSVPEYSGVSVKFVEVSPDLAKSWLQLNRHNRNLRESTVNAYARDMRAGDWITNHQGLAFSEDGSLLDGQHRLHGIVRSGVTVVMMVSTGWPSVRGNTRVGTMDTVDVGAGRSLTDLLKLQHETENPRVVTATARVLAKLVSGAQKTSMRMSMSTLLAISAEFSKGMQWTAQNAPKRRGIRIAEVLASCVVGIESFPKERVAGWIDGLNSGAGLFDGDSRLVLRNYLLSDGPRRDTKNNQIMAIVAAHLRGYIEGEKVTRLIRDDLSALEWFTKLQEAKFKRIEELVRE